MSPKFKVKKSKNIITVKTTILLLAIGLLIISVGYSKLTSILTIHGTVTGVYRNLEDYTYIVEEDETDSTLTVVADDITASSPVTISDYLNIEHTGINISEKYINKIDVTLIYSTSTGSVQTVNCVLTVNGTTYTKTVTFGKKKTNETVTVTFDGLHIDPNETFLITAADASTTNKSITISQQSIKVYLAE